MKKRLLILCSVLVLVVAMAAPAFAASASPESLVNTIWSASDTFWLREAMEATYQVNFTSGSQPFSTISFVRQPGSYSEEYYILLKFDDQLILKINYMADDDGYIVINENNIADYSKLIITGGADAENDSLISSLEAAYQYDGVYTPPIYQAVPDRVTGALPGFLEIIGSILTALFTPSGDLFQLGVVIAVCFGGAVIYGGVRLFRKLTPGV